MATWRAKLFRVAAGLFEACANHCALLISSRRIGNDTVLSRPDADHCYALQRRGYRFASVRAGHDGSGIEFEPGRKCHYSVRIPRFVPASMPRRPGPPARPVQLDRLRLTAV
jgi:hypothetical protein